MTIKSWSSFKGSPPASSPLITEAQKMALAVRFPFQTHAKRSRVVADLDGGEPVPCSLALVEGHQVKQDVQKGKRLPGFGTLKAKVCAVSGPRLLDSAFGRAGPRVPESPPDPYPASMPADSIPQLNSPT